MTNFGLHGEFVLYRRSKKIKSIQTKAIHFITKELNFYLLYSDSFNIKEFLSRKVN